MLIKLKFLETFTVFDVQAKTLEEATNKVVNFACNTNGSNCDENLIGKVIPVRIEEVLPNSLTGKMIQTLDRK